MSDRKLRSAWFVLRAFWRASPEVRQGIVTAAALFDRCDIWPNGVQVTIWVTPDESRYGGGGMMEPLNESGDGTISQRPVLTLGDMKPPTITANAPWTPDAPPSGDPSLSNPTTP